MLKKFFLVLCVYTSMAGAALGGQPTPYTRQHNFTDHTQNLPDVPQDGGELDDEFNAVKGTLDDTLTNLSLIQRDDGALANDSVGADQLKDDVDLGINPVGDWTTATAYGENDAVWKDQILYRCLIAHTSGVFATDLAASKWEALLNFATYIQLAATSETNAAASASAASSSASASSASASSASASATTASGYVAALTGTSSTSVLIATGSKAFTTQAGKSFANTQVLIASAANTANYMHGNVTAYTGTSLTVNVTNIGGSGTFSDWVISIAGTRGAQGATGATGPAGAGSGDMIAANNLSDVVSASTARTNLGLGTIATQNSNGVSITGGTVTGIMDLTVADGGTGASTAANARTNLGIVIGTDVQAQDADLSAIAGLTSAANKGIQFTGSGTAATYDLTAAGKALLDDADASAQRTTLGLGTAAIANTGTSAGNVVVLDGSAKLPAVDGSALTNISGGDFTLVSAQTAAGSSVLDFTGLSSSCAAYKFIFTNIRPSTNGASLYFRTSTDGGVSFSSSASNYLCQKDLIDGSSSTPTRTLTGACSTAYVIKSSVSSTASQTVSGELTLYRPSDIVSYKYISSEAIAIAQGSGDLATDKSFGVRANVADVDAARFQFSAGTITTGAVYAYCESSS